MKVTRVLKFHSPTPLVTSGSATGVVWPKKRFLAVNSRPRQLCRACRGAQNSPDRSAEILMGNPRLVVDAAVQR